MGRCIRSMSLSVSRARTRSILRLPWFAGCEAGMKKTHIKTDLPGPKARELVARDALVVSPSYPRDYPFVMSHGKGAEVWDVDGNRFLDFAAGIAVCSTGHSHPRVVAAIKEAADRFLHISSDYWHESQVRLAEVMNETAPLGE